MPFEEVGLGAAPIKLMVKDEPHKLSKFAEGRYRLISILSLEDQLLDRLLFIGWIIAERDNPEHCVSKVGWCPIPAGYQQLLVTMPDNRKCWAVDKKAWDWTMPGWVVKTYVDTKLGLTNTNGVYTNIVYNRVAEVVGPRCVVALPDGTLLRQLTWGLQKSGWLLTLSLNSAAQDMQHLLACRRLGWPDEGTIVWAMGDDLLCYANWSEEQASDYAAALDKTGCIVKYIKNVREFCGFSYERGCDPLYQDKHKFLMEYCPLEKLRDLISTYSVIYALSDASWFWKVQARYALCGQEPYRRFAQGLGPCPPIPAYSQ